MSYLKLILKNPFRNKTRSSFAIIGIALGIMVIVALGMVTGGLETSTQSTLKSGAAEYNSCSNWIKCWFWKYKRN